MATVRHPRKEGWHMISFHFGAEFGIYFEIIRSYFYS